MSNSAQSNSAQSNSANLNQPLPAVFDPQEPIWTAWLLDELSGAERAALDRIVAASPEAQAWVREMRSLTGELKVGLANEPLPALTAGQRDALASASRTSATGASSTGIVDQPLSEAALARSVAIPRKEEPAMVRSARWRMWGSSLALTAAIAAGIAVVPKLMPGDRASQIAQTSAPEGMLLANRDAKGMGLADEFSKARVPNFAESASSDPVSTTEYIVATGSGAGQERFGMVPENRPAKDLSLLRSRVSRGGQPAVASQPASGPATDRFFADSVASPSRGLADASGPVRRGEALASPAAATSAPRGSIAPPVIPAPVALATTLPPVAAKPSNETARYRLPERAKGKQNLEEQRASGDKAVAARRELSLAESKPQLIKKLKSGADKTEWYDSQPDGNGKQLADAKPDADNRGNAGNKPQAGKESGQRVDRLSIVDGETGQPSDKPASLDNLAALPQESSPKAGDASESKNRELREFDETEPLEKVRKQAEREEIQLRQQVTELQVAEREAVQLPALQQVDALNDLADRYDELVRSRQDGNTEAYDQITDNTFQRALGETALSTFSIDVDTAAYTNLRRYLNGGSLPPRGAIRIEELVNYFPYSDAAPTDGSPFSARIEIAECPWQPQHRLARVALKGREIAVDQRPVSNLVFLVDVSGSMQDENKLPLVREGLRMLVNQLGENDRVAIVVYAGASGLVLPSTSATNKQLILSAIDNLQAGGSTNGGAGIELAYKVAVENFIKGGANRVILCTDGDFNVGVTSRDELIRLVEEKAKANVFATILGFGMGNLKDSTLEQLADKGNGQYGYIDSLGEARKQFVDQLSGTLVTIAKDVKIQLEFNPAKVAGYRLIGYENRVMANQDFRNDAKDAGEIGAGHSVTALYEIIPAGQSVPQAGEAQSLKYQLATTVKPEAATSIEWLTLRLRHKAPEGDKASEQEFTATDAGARFGEASIDFRWSAAVASFGMVLRDSPYKGMSTLPMVKELAEAAKGTDAAGYRAEFVELVKKAEGLLPPK